MRGRLLHALALVATMCAFAACGNGSGRVATTTRPVTATTTPTTTSQGVTAAPPLPRPFTGDLDAFYDPPKPLPAARPGTLIRYQPVGENADEITWRILYHSIDAAGRDQPTPGMITFPVGTPPRGGWPVVSNAPGTVGLASACALSRADDRPDAFGVRGVSVRTDYIGMVKGQRQRYLSGVSEAHSVIDAVRAARTIRQAHAGRRWVAFGHSQGGHAALFTNGLAHSYAPELDLLGTVAGAPASRLTNLYGPDGRAVPNIVELMAMFGIAQDHPGSDPTALLTPAARQRLGVLEHGCVKKIIAAFEPIAAQGLFVTDPMTVEPTATLLREADPGRVVGPSPVLLFEGTADGYVLPSQTEVTRMRLCSAGQVTQYLQLEGADHATEIKVGRPQIQRWIADRFAGQRAPDNCPSDWPRTHEHTTSADS